MRRSLRALAIGAGLFAGYVDLHSEEFYAAIILLLAFTFLFGYVLPKLAWKLAVLVGLGVPVVILAAYYLGYEPAWVEGLREWTPEFTYDLSEALQSVLALIPSFIGAYGGALIRSLVSKSPK